MTQPHRSELVIALRRAEERLREIGSDWQSGRSSWGRAARRTALYDRHTGWVRFETLEVANDLLRLLLRIDAGAVSGEAAEVPSQAAVNSPPNHKPKG